MVMSILHLLTKLNPSSNRFEYVSPGMLSEITRYDVAASLHGLAEGPLLLAYLYSSDSEGICDKLRDCLLLDVQRIAEHQKWRCRKETDFLRRMCSVAITEHFNPRRCVKCKGSGILLAKMCDKCGGLGQEAYQPCEIARMCGFIDNHWKRVWESKYNQILNILMQYEKILVKHLISMLK